MQLKVEDIYGRDLERCRDKVPQGWELTGEFRQARIGESFLDLASPGGWQINTPTTVVELYRAPVLIAVREDKPSPVEIEQPKRRSIRVTN